MPSPLHLSGSIQSKSRLTQWALLLILVALGGLLFLETGGNLAGVLAKGSASGSPSQTIQTHVGQISSAINSYLKKHDGESLERIKGEGREANRLIQEFKDKLLQDGKSEYGQQVERDHQRVRQATVDLLGADQAVVKTNQSLVEASGSLTTLLDQMQSTIRSNSMNASGKMRAIRNARAEISNAPKGKSRFNRAMDTYEDLSNMRRAERWADEGRTLFGQYLSLTNDLQQAEQKRQAALDDFSSKKKVLNRTLQEAPKDQAAGTMSPLYIGVNAALLLFAFILVFKNYGRSGKQLARSLREILQCVEAAAAGDTSRVPDYWSTDEVGQLSQATARLIGVLARSENLIYHLAALIESSGDAIVSQTLDGKILSWNKGAQRIYGYSAEEVKGQSIAMLSPEDEGEQLLHCLQNVRNGERLKPFETSHQARNGRRVQVLLRVAAIYDSTRKIIGSSLIAQDLTGTEIHPKSSRKREAV